ncbi:conjugal transfer protein TraD [Sphingomonas sp. ST-64]|uniref:Conjugal transfer protein TraD n=1 Tax=Sphingomonas plantiphila TaxID=3163295 RepID=A0ABW8YMP9_9SPHN
MRKPRDYDAELKALNDKARQLREQKLRQLGELVVSIGADTFPVEQLAGALLSAIDTKDAAIKEDWRKRGAAFFQAAPRGARGADKNDHRPAQSASGEAPPASEDRA